MMSLIGKAKSFLAGMERSPAAPDAGGVRGQEDWIDSPRLRGAAGLDVQLESRGSGLILRCESFVSDREVAVEFAAEHPSLRILHHRRALVQSRTAEPEGAGPRSFSCEFGEEEVAPTDGGKLDFPEREFPSE